jgi:hypothetical protein
MLHYRLRQVDEWQQILTYTPLFNLTYLANSFHFSQASVGEV